MKHVALSLALIATALAACAPTTGGAGNTSSHVDLRDRGATTASISGTVLDARSGEPVAGAEITGPGGSKARSDAKGRFVLEELEVGRDGAVEARLSDGRKARVTLLPLANARLEIVLHVR